MNMKSQKLIVRIICIVLALLLVLSFIVMIIPARAVSQTDIEQIREKRELLEQQMEAQAEVVRALEENRTLIIDRKSALDRQIALTQESIRLMEEELAIYDEMILEKESQLELARTAEQTQMVKFRARVRSMEENGNYSYVSFLLQSTSIGDFLSRLGDVRDVMHYDRELERSLSEARANLEQVKLEYEQIQADQSAIRRELTEKRELLDAQIEAACQLIVELESRTDDAKAEYDAIEAAEKEAYEQEQQAVAEYAAQILAAQMSQAYTAGSTAPVSGDYVSTDGSTIYVSIGGFIWPVDSTYITSRYGYRQAPTAGASSYHKAIDIGAAAGSPIYAAADGTVVVATYNDGLGNYVSILHADGTTTRYSHMSSYAVSAGQQVTQGQVIGYVGATGIATGNHLDFAVIQNGEQVDPLQFYDSSGLTFDPTA